jgi:hypothetical protein
MPARSSSVFFTDLDKDAHRTLSASNTAYSVLGMEMLSRTIFGFLVFSALGVAGFAVTFALDATGF